MGKLFGTDGIRGIANVYPMNSETALAVGKAVAAHFKNGSLTSAKHLVIGKDTRLSGDMLAQAVAAGACAAGADVHMVGVLPTPGIAYLASSTGALAGVVISASHNPYEDNGIKLFGGNGYKLADEVEEKIESLIFSSNNGYLAPSKAIGRLRTLTTADNQYLAFLRSAGACRDFNDLNIVLDCAHGATYQVAPELFRRLGCNVVSLYCAPDGTNINKQCGSQHPEHLAQAVVAHGADAGLAFDGDGDRLIAVDETGGVLSGDQILAICACDLKRRGELKNNAVVSTIMSNMGFRLALRNMEIHHHITQVGDRYVMEKMLSEGAVLGGEDSGHLIFNDVHTTGDGLLAALRLLNAMQSAGKPLSDLAKVMTVFPQKLVNVDVKEKPDLAAIPEIAQAIARVENELGDKGRVLVRYSGTQNKCRVMVEGPTMAQTHTLCDEIATVIQRAIG
jgi:phosphoglucosamine mutase